MLGEGEGCLSGLGRPRDERDAGRRPRGQADPPPQAEDRVQDRAGGARQAGPAVQRRGIGRRPAAAQEPGAVGLVLHRAVRRGDMDGPDRLLVRGPGPPAGQQGIRTGDELRLQEQLREGRVGLVGAAVVQAHLGVAGQVELAGPIPVVAPPRNRSCYSLSLANDIAAQAALHARVIIAEVNPDAPWTHGAELPSSLAPHILVEARHKPIELPPAQVGPTELAIARLAAGLIPDGATLQLGVGTIPDAVLSQLSAHRDIGIHSGQIGDSVIPLIENGVITNARKSIHPGVSVCGSLFGTRRLYDLAHLNSAIAVRPPSETHSLRVMATIDRFIAVNSAIEVDLTGQVNAEVAGGVYVGGLGGQLDFMRGANASAGGRAIIALPATTRDGTISRIVPSMTTVTCPVQTSTRS